MTILANYTRFGGVHPETAALANAMACAGVVAPHTGQPYTEAMVLGVGGGLGAGYIMYEFKEHNAKVVVLGFSKNWQYPQKFMDDVARRLNLRYEVMETGGAKAAAQHLDDALRAGHAPVAWADRASLPYRQLPEYAQGYSWHFVAVCGQEDGRVYVDDLARAPFAIPSETLASARSRIASSKNRLFIIQGGGDVDLPAAVREGILDCIAHLSEKSDSFSLPTFRKWAKTMTDTKGAKAWGPLFADGKGLFGALRSIYENIRLDGGNGGGLRGLYADFLDEAAPLLNNPALSDVAARYRDLAAGWNALADAALPDDVAPLGEMKRLLREKWTLLVTEGAEGLPAMQPLTEQIDALHAEHNRRSPLSDSDARALFERLSVRLHDLYDGETAALAALKSAME